MECGGEDAALVWRGAPNLSVIASTSNSPQGRRAPNCARTAIDRLRWGCYFCFFRIANARAQFSRQSTRYFVSIRVIRAIRG